VKVELRDVRPVGPFEFRWPDALESFDHGWEGTVIIDDRPMPFRHGIGRRPVYGRDRVHSVTWLARQPTVEGVEADDYEHSGALISRIRRPDRKMARTPAEVPPGYERFEIVTHRDEIDAPYSPGGLAVKVREDDLEAWGRLAALRLIGPGGKVAVGQTTRGRRPTSPPLSGTPSGRQPVFDPLPRERKLAVTRELARHEEELNGPLRRGTGKLTGLGERRWSSVGALGTWTRAGCSRNPTRWLRRSGGSQPFTVT
jgi:hypothetical protein